MEHLDKKVQQRIMRAMRTLWFQTFRNKVLSQSAVRDFPLTKKGVPSKRAVIKGYTCASCKDYFMKNYVQVDHKISVHTGKTLLERIELLWCPIEDLQVLCKGCHQDKTNRER